MKSPCCWGRAVPPISFQNEEIKVLEISREKFEVLSKEIPEFTDLITRMVLRRLIDQDERKIVRIREKAVSQTDSELSGHGVIFEQSRDTEGSLNQIIDATSIQVKPIWGKPKASPEYTTDIFVIMPFREPFNDIYELYLKKLATEMGLTIKRGDDPFVNNSLIMHDIWALMNASKLIIADCTLNNPNVFYELGIAHTLGKPTIILTQEATVPFDVTAFRYISYEYTVPALPESSQNYEN